MPWWGCIRRRSSWTFLLLVNVLRRQTQHLIGQPVLCFKVSIAVGIKRACIQTKSEYRSNSSASLRYSLLVAGVACQCALSFNRPVRIAVSQHSVGAIEHITLRDEEVANIQTLISPVGQRGGSVILIRGLLLQTKQRGDSMLMC